MGRLERITLMVAFAAIGSGTAIISIPLALIVVGILLIAAVALS